MFEQRDSSIAMQMRPRAEQTARLAGDFDNEIGMVTLAGIGHAGT
jgi:hypothetical protein